MGLFLILTAVVLGSADEKSQDQDVSTFSRVPREAENSNSKKGINVSKRNKAKNGGRKIKNGRKRHESKTKKINRNKKKTSNKNKKKREKRIRKKQKGSKNNKSKTKKRNRNKTSKKNNNKVKRRGKNQKGSRKNRSKSNRIGTKQKGRRKNRNKSKKRGGKATRRNRQTSTVSATCYSQTVFMMNIWKNVVTNFKKQNARMKSQNSTGEGKSGKKGLFAPTAFKLIDIGGGNRSNLSCGGTYGSDGAKQLGNLTKTLFDCELSVNTSCNPANFPQPDTTFIEGCETSTSSFETQGKACLKKVNNVTAACECFTSSSFNKTAEAVKDCDASKYSAPIKKQLNKCKAAFSKCRKYEDDAVDALSACTKTQQQHTQKAAQLKANQDALSAAKTKMASLASGATSSRHRGARQTATSCSSVITKATTLISIVTSFPEATIVLTLSAEITSVSSTVTCTTAEKNSMTTVVTTMTTAINTVTQALVVVQKLLLQTTGTTQATSDLTTSPATTASSASTSSSDSASSSGSTDSASTSGSSDSASTAGSSDSASTAGSSDSATTSGSSDSASTAAGATSGSTDSTSTASAGSSDSASTAGTSDSASTNSGSTPGSSDSATSAASSASSLDGSTSGDSSSTMATTTSAMRRRRRNIEKFMEKLNRH